MDRVMLNVKVDGKTRGLTIEKRKTVKQLYEAVRKNFFKNQQNFEFHLLCEDAEFTALDENSYETIESLDIQQGATLIILIRVPGGSCSKLKPLPGYIEVTTSPCDITYEEDPSVSRAKMPCGCVIGLKAMRIYCETIINGGKFLFPCPACESSWRLQWVRHVLTAVSSIRWMRAFNWKVRNKFIVQEPKILQCPKCMNFLERNPLKEYGNRKRIKCPLCSARNCTNDEFCLVCLKPWTGDSSSCGNAGCNGIDRRIYHLQTCDTKTIGDVSKVPSIRCCVKCGTLINHKDQCKHVKCKCGYAFCFVCLKPKVSSENPGRKWQCGYAYDSCNVAPRQQHLFEIVP